MQDFVADVKPFKLYEQGCLFQNVYFYSSALRFC